MENNSSVFIPLLNFLAAIVLLTIAAALFFRRNNVKANIFLGLIISYPAISILSNIVFIIFRQHQLLFLAPATIGFNLTFGPVLLTYLHLIQGKNEKAPLFHFIPAILVFLSSIYYLTIPEATQVVVLNEVLTGKHLYINLINLFLLIHLCFYLYRAWHGVNRYSKAAADLNIPHIENSIQWQKSLLRCLITINISLLLAFALPELITGSAHIYSDLIATPVCALLIYVFMIFKGSSYHVIYNQIDYSAFTEAAQPLNNYVTELKSPTVYKDEFILDKKAQLLQLFENQKIFTQPGLKLHDVAEMMEISPAALSFIINKQLDMTFFEMVNKYRVEEAKKLFVCPEHQHYKIESIGKLSGFNSKASFFSVFKKLAGTTPQMFKEEYLRGKS